MNCFDAFFDSMNAPKTPRKRTISHVENSVATLDSTAHHKRSRSGPYQPPALPYIFTEREMNLMDSPKELDDDRERERDQEHTSRFDDGTALKKALDLLMSPPTSTPAALSDCRTSPSSFSSSATSSPLISRRAIRHYRRPAGPVTDPTRTVPMLQLIEPEETPQWLQLSKIFEENESAMINYDLLLVPGTPLPEAQPEFDIQPSLVAAHPPEDEDAKYLADLEALIEAYF
ncbi:uncharacterized protein MELLADRAFT_59999 [Melampsora larici-populina 98AG31]|uniref:Uncharacterized protein n=1 Tax=Melampsora larici-populina (strain 98AG31 / pathotype 3-4-7) TaxID=747676 RepID=F4R9L3_MELLP|nr:uncharacterized protein MELLADRAFT_59999 [Melampsora larici-populina 98AG31]EGG11130.1 hypothetical protein MELLADRAFT_59999 [Melampsora larici-populina 98AG31]